MLKWGEVTLRLAEQKDQAEIASIAAEGASWLFWDSGAVSLDEVFKVLLSTEEGTLSRLWVAERVGTVVGFASLNDISPVHKAAEIRFVGVRKSAGAVWTMLLIVKALLAFGFGTLNLHRMYGKVFGSHRVLHALYRRAGFRQESCIKEAIWHNGRWEDIVQYGLLNAEWKGA